MTKEDKDHIHYLFSSLSKLKDTYYEILQQLEERKIKCHINELEDELARVSNKIAKYNLLIAEFGNNLLKGTIK